MSSTHLPSPDSLTRRRIVHAATSAWIGGAFVSSLAHAQSARRATPPQTEGPYYPVSEPKDADFDLLKNGDLTYTAGQMAWVTGRVVDLDGRALSGGSIEIWQCDQDGHYDHPRDGSRSNPAFQGFGRVVLDSAGNFRFRTIKPVAYVGRTPHIHAKVRLAKRELLTSQLYVAGDPGNAKDSIWRRMAAEDRASVTSPFLATPDGLRAEYEITVRT